MHSYALLIIREIGVAQATSQLQYYMTKSTRSKIKHTQNITKQNENEINPYYCSSKDDARRH